MNDDPLRGQVREYIRQNRDRYTVEALRARLVGDGVPAEVVDEVLAETEGSPYLGPPAFSAPPAARRWSPLRIFLVVLGSLVLNLGVGGGVLALGLYTESIVPVLIAPLVVAAEIAAAVVYARRDHSVSLGIALGLVATPVAAAVLPLGFCVYLLSQY
jgi:hypothetical protein